MRKALQELIELVKTKQVVICRTDDKDGRIVIVSYGDYHTIMTNQLQKFTKLPHQIDSLPKHFDSLRKQGEAFCKDLHQAGIISDQILFHTTGLKFKNQIYQRITANLAKYFVCKTQPFYIRCLRHIN